MLQPTERMRAFRGPDHLGTVRVTGTTPVPRTTLSCSGFCLRCLDVAFRLHAAREVFYDVNEIFERLRRIVGEPGDRRFAARWEGAARGLLHLAPAQWRGHAHHAPIR